MRAAERVAENSDLSSEAWAAEDLPRDELPIAAAQPGEGRLTEQTASRSVREAAEQVSDFPHRRSPDAIAASNQLLVRPNPFSASSARSDALSEIAAANLCDCTLAGLLFAGLHDRHRDGRI